jgi:hypothetical protein
VLTKGVHGEPRRSDFDRVTDLCHSRLPSRSGRDIKGEALG